MVSVPPRKRQSTFALSSAKNNDFVLLRETKPKKRFSHGTVSLLHYFFPSYKYFLAEVQVIEQRVSLPKL